MPVPAINGRRGRTWISVTGSERERFDELWSKYAGFIYAYAARRVGSDDADEIVSEVFGVAWRRIDDVPERALPWLYGVGHNVIREHRRSTDRRARLQEALDHLPPTSPTVDRTAAVLEALLSLDESDREVLRLVAWEQLRPQEAADALGINGAAFRMRLTRARRRFRAALAEQQVVEHEA
jgi:RNA polymerase sigma-70 factor (ECF subfamily)